ncbi:YcgL domain-containing protein [Simiduia curdlanivorans]|uniref:YcgL domain-containing protein ACFOX3_15335 n=1 Tax=Simiduia curdlanivorans TaxID=1492769 RepID=A0ABV8VAE0_9GAMM|nr:YcgL domain-containing protein [Simiduia curdlanivorans]MDN3639038.1 YcgL domain-containing protein [Simiduia curdlanivorans]
MTEALKSLCEVYKSPKDSDMFLYVRKLDGLSRVPAALLEKFGKPILAMTLLLKDGRKLARVDVDKVKLALDANGFFLQLPPPKDDYMTDVNKHNSKLV